MIEETEYEDGAGEENDTSQGQGTDHGMEETTTEDSSGKSTAEEVLDFIDNNEIRIKKRRDIEDLKKAYDIVKTVVDRNNTTDDESDT